MYFHLAEDEWQVYFISHDTTAIFSMYSKVFHSSAYLVTSNKENLIICAKSPSDCHRLFSSFLNYNICHIHKETLDLLLRRVILNAYDLCLLCWAVFHSFKKSNLFHLREKWHVTALIKKTAERWEEKADPRITVILLPLWTVWGSLGKVTNWGCLAWSAQSFCS